MCAEHDEVGECIADIEARVCKLTDVLRPAVSLSLPTPGAPTPAAPGSVSIRRTSSIRPALALQHVAEEAEVENVQIKRGFSVGVSASAQA